MPKIFGFEVPEKFTPMSYFDVEVYDGTAWLSLNDQVNYRINSESLGQSSQQRKRQTVTSEMYDGEFEVHSTLGNVSETLTVYVMAEYQNDVSINLLRVINAFSQRRYNVRISRDDDVETWLCQPADWSVVRSQVESHNKRATLTLTVNRFPQVTYAVRS